MRRLVVMVTLVAFVVLLGSAVTRAQTPGKWTPEAMKIIAAAKKEGRVNFYGVDLSPQEMKQLEQGLNKMFGTSLVLEHEPSRHFGVKAATMVSEAKAGLPSPNDAMNMNPPGMDLLARQDLLRSLDSLPKAFADISPDWIINQGRALVFWHAAFGTVYNTNQVSKDKVPKKWEDLLSPAWKDKMIMSTGLDQFTALAETWGVERVSEFLRVLKGRNVAVAKGGDGDTAEGGGGRIPRGRDANLRNDETDSAQGGPP